MLLIPTAASAEQQQKPQEKVKVVKVHRIHVAKPVCPGLRRAIVYYRGLVWQRQDSLGEHRSPTNYPERRKHACAYKRYVMSNWRAIALEYRKLLAHLDEPVEAIKYVFRERADEALSVAWCESRLHITAQNGQYLGLFQMGSYARQLYGHSYTAIGQAESAHAYFVASGSDWSPWSCKP